MAVTNSTDLNDLMGTIINSEALSAAYGARIMRNLVYAVQVPQGAQSITIPSFSGVAVGSLTEGTAPGSTGWGTAGQTLTPVERGVYVQISKHVLYADPFSDLAPYGNQLGLSLAKDEDTMIATEFTNFTAATIGASGASLTKNAFLSGIAAMEATDMPGPICAVFHPSAWAPLRTALGDAAVMAAPGTKIVEGFGTGLTNMNGFVGAPYGVPCFISTKVPNLGGVGNYVNGMFKKQAIGYGYMQDLSVDVFDNVTARAFDLMAWYAGDAAIVRAELGVKLIG
jgi:hypothetical protein